MREYLIDVAHNDHRTGLPSGYCDAIELKYKGWKDGSPSCRINYGRCVFREIKSMKKNLERFQFSTVRVHMRMAQFHYGNWCWDEYIIAEGELIRVLMAVWRTFSMDEAPTEIFECWERNGFDAREFLRLLRGVD